MFFVQIECKREVRDNQYRTMDWIGYADIEYNFLVGGDGAAYVGRGWDFEGKSTPGCNAKSIAIAFIGTFEDEIPPKQQIEAAQKLIKEGVNLSKLSASYRLYGADQLNDVESPHKMIYQIIRKWDHWTDTNQNSAEICDNNSDANTNQTEIADNFGYHATF